MRVKLKVLKKTKAFYKWLLEEKEMTEKQENAIIKTKETLDRIIKKRTQEKEKNKKNSMTKIYLFFKEVRNKNNSYYLFTLLTKLKYSF